MKIFKDKKEDQPKEEKKVKIISTPSTNPNIFYDEYYSPWDHQFLRQPPKILKPAPDAVRGLTITDVRPRHDEIIMHNRYGLWLSPNGSNALKLEDGVVSMNGLELTDSERIAMVNMAKTADQILFENDYLKSEVERMREILAVYVENGDQDEGNEE